MCQPGPLRGQRNSCKGLGAAEIAPVALATGITQLRYLVRVCVRSGALRAVWALDLFRNPLQGASAFGAALCGYAGPLAWDLWNGGGMLEGRCVGMYPGCRWGEVVAEEPFVGRRSHSEVHLGPEVGRQPYEQCLIQVLFFLGFKHTVRRARGGRSGWQEGWGFQRRYGVVKLRTT
jgi:hypothetical protein